MSNLELISPARGPGNLVRHAAGAEHHDAQVFRIGRDGLADRAAEIEAALAGRRRVLHDIHGERNDRAGPFGRRAEREVERHRQAMIDFHLVDDGEVEPVEDGRRRDVRGKLRMALHHRHRARAPAFVGGRKLRRAAEREGRDQLDRERRGVIVVDRDHDVGLDLGHPLLGLLEAGEDALPVRVFGLLIVDGGADGRHVRRGESCDDLCHGVTSASLRIWTWALRLWLRPSWRACLLPDLERLPSTERPPASIIAA